MSLRNIYDPLQNQYIVPSIDVEGGFEIDNVPFNPSGTGGTQNLSSVLTVGNDGGNLDIKNVNNLTTNSTLNTDSLVCASFQATDGAFDYQLQFTGNSNGYGQIKMADNASNNNYQMSGGRGTNGLTFAQFSSTSKLNQPLQLREDGSVWIGDSLSALPYVYICGSSGVKGRVYDSQYNVPPVPTLQNVLTSNNSAGSLSITNLNSLSVGAITCTTINGHAPSSGGGGGGTIEYLRGYNKTYNVSSVGTNSTPFTLAQFSNASLSDGNYFELYFDFMIFSLSNGNSNGYGAQLYLSQSNNGSYNSSTGNFYAINDGVTGVDVSLNNSMLNFFGTTGVSQLYLICVFTSTVSTQGTATINFNGSIKCMNATAGTF